MSQDTTHTASVFFDRTAGAAQQRALFFTMLRIRRVQERIALCYLYDAMKTPVHLCIGQEGVAAGVCQALDRDDFITSNHRGHGHYLAKGGDLRAMVAELHGRRTGCAGGYGGSMHLVDTGVGHLGASAIVGGGIPLGTGLGLAIRMQGSDRVSAVFFGDGAADEGVLYESVNFAVLKKLPVIFILENNRWSVCSPPAARQPWDLPFHHVDPDLLAACKVDGNDVLAVYRAAVAAIGRARSGGGPSLVQCDTYRILGHAGCQTQDPAGYRPAQEVERWRRRCPLKRFQRWLSDRGILPEEDVQAMEDRIRQEIDAAFCFAEESPLPDSARMGAHLFQE